MAETDPTRTYPSDLPVLALWVRKAVVDSAARVVVVNAQNGLARDTAHWLKAPAGEETPRASSR